VESPDKGQVCFIFQNLLLKTNKQRLLYLRVGYFGKDKTPTALFTLPLGVSLPGGVSLKIDDRKKIRIRYERCDKTGCLAPLALRDEQIKALQTGLKAQVAFFDTRGREISIPVSLLGFTAGFKSLKK
jgi:invasion protein IalB